MNGEVISINTANKLAIYEKNLRKKLEYKKRIEKAIEYINKLCLCSDGYTQYGDDLNPKHIVNILKGETDGSNK